MNQELLAVWQDWERRTGNTESKLELYADGSGTFDHRDLHGPTYDFDSLAELKEYLTL